MKRTTVITAAAFCLLTILITAAASEATTLNLRVDITDKDFTVSAAGGSLPPLTYREYHYHTVGSRSDLVEYTPKPGEPAPDIPIEDMRLFVTDGHKVIHVAYNASDQLLTDDGGSIAHSVKRGETLYALTGNGRRRVTVNNPADFLTKPLSAFDAVQNLLIMVRERYGEARDLNSIVIATEDGTANVKAQRVGEIARNAGFTMTTYGQTAARAPARGDANVAHGRAAAPGEIDAILASVGGAQSGGSAQPGVSLPELSEFTITGGRSRENIQNIVQRNMAALRHAYNRRLREKPGLQGRITVRFSVDASGRVTAAQVTESTLKDSELEKTLVTRIRSWDFERFNRQNDVTTVIYPFVFTPE